ncbi:hypothetical protein U9M48_004623 [Paspalum notatum var. saurae]|uniref:Uncharacterized protein n=1 Tax=Paspalum notatum var. saurae TaxID=547442 RepID=A0AAQ3SLE7_PASNO
MKENWGIRATRTPPRAPVRAEREGAAALLPTHTGRGWAGPPALPSPRASRVQSRESSPPPAAAVEQRMEPPPPPLRPASSSPERAGPSALGDVGRCLGVEHLDKADEDEVTDAADAPRKGQRLEEAAIVELPGKGRDNRFVPIKDVKGMLQTGHFEGVKIAYCTKKDKSCLLSGVMHGMKRPGFRDAEIQSFCSSR